EDDRPDFIYQINNYKEIIKKCPIKRHQQKGVSMRDNLKILVLINFILLSSACTTTKMTLVSEPQGADVFVTDNSGREEKLGQTPLEFNKDILAKLPNNIWRLTVDKAGFLKDQIYIESKMFQEIGSISIALTPEANWKEAYQDANAYKYLNDVSG